MAPLHRSNFAGDADAGQVHVLGGKLLTLKVTAGEQRWFRGAKKAPACRWTWESSYE